MNRGIMNRGIILLLISLVIFNCTTKVQTIENEKVLIKTISYKTFDGYNLKGKLVLPVGVGSFPIILHVQTAQGTTMDISADNASGNKISTLDLHRSQFAKIGIGFFSYEGRGIFSANTPPRYEKIDWAIYNTSTLDNKVADVITSVRIL